MHVLMLVGNILDYTLTRHKHFTKQRDHKFNLGLKLRSHCVVQQPVGSASGVIPHVEGSIPICIQIFRKY